MPSMCLTVLGWGRKVEADRRVGVGDETRLAMSWERLQLSGEGLL